MKMMKNNIIRNIKKYSVVYVTQYNTYSTIRRGVTLMVWSSCDISLYA